MNSLIEFFIACLFCTQIINRVVSFLALRDLKTCRLLNHQWNEECCKYLWKRSTIRLNSVDAFKNHFSNVLYNEESSRNYLSSFQLWEPIPELISNHGQFIKVLKVENFIPTSRELNSDVLPVLETLCVICSNVTPAHNFFVGKKIFLFSVKKLELFVSSVRVPGICKSPFLLELLGSVPNVEILSVPKVPRMLKFGMPLFHTVLTSEQLQFSHLTKFDMDVALYNGSIRILEKRGFPLKYLNAEINSGVLPDLLISLISSLSNTLVHMNLKFPRSDLASECNFSR